MVATGEVFPFAGRVVDVPAAAAARLVSLFVEAGIESRYDGYAVEFLAGADRERVFRLAVAKLRARGYVVLVG
jgi:hypothetical protein